VENTEDTAPAIVVKATDFGPELESEPIDRPTDPAIVARKDGGPVTLLDPTDL
jgi:hypothetical protein